MTKQQLAQLAAAKMAVDPNWRPPTTTTTNQAAVSTWTPQNLQNLATAASDANPNYVPPGDQAAPPPFLEPEQQQALDAIISDANSQYDDILQSIRKATADTTFQETQNDQNARQSTGNAIDDSIARGLFQSSIKDANLYDIEAQRSMRKSFLDDNLTLLTQDAQRKSDALFGPAGIPGHITGGTVGQAQMNYGRQAVANANAIEPPLPKLQASGTTTTTGITPQAAPTSKPTGVPTATGGTQQARGKQTRMKAVAQNKTRKKAFAGAA